MEQNSCIRIFADEVQIKNCRNKLLTAEVSFTLLAQILSLAGNEVRLKILYLLEEEIELCVCDISDILGMSIPAVSQHLRKLKDANVIKFRKSGQTIFYSMKQEHLQIIKPLFQHISHKNIKEQTV
ncbi:MAG: metalloregulator ArsR/SmtB family transcription factor [Mucilaginibacter sp.]